MQRNPPPKPLGKVRQRRRRTSPPTDRLIMGHYPEGNFAVQYRPNFERWQIQRDGSLVDAPELWSEMPEMGSPILVLPAQSHYDKQRDARRQGILDKGKDARSALEDMEIHAPAWVKIIREYIALLESQMR